MVRVELWLGLVNNIPGNHKAPRRSESLFAILLPLACFLEIEPSHNLIRVRVRVRVKVRIKIPGHLGNFFLESLGMVTQALYLWTFIKES